MSTRACYRFIDPVQTLCGGITTVYKHSDGYPEGGVAAIRNAIPYSWPLPRFEADEFAAGFVAGNKESAADKQRRYLDRAAEATTDDDRKTLTEMAANWGPGGRYADMVGGNVRLVAASGLDAFKEFASDIEYLYDVTVKAGKLRIKIQHASERNGSWAFKPEFEGTLDEAVAKYLKA